MQFGKYRLIEKIGQGGMAEVFYAHIVGREGFTKEVALKRVLPHLCEDPDFVKSFIDEARLGGLLNHHHIVQTLDFGNEDGIYYIAMEYVHGLTLRELMTYHKRRGKEIPPPIVLDIVLQLCDGLRYAHHAEDETGRPLNMVHRDLKPTNILLSSHGVIKIADFGIARAETNSRRTALGGILKGTAQYMSPEQAFGELSLDRRSDIFSLGSITYELVTLRALFHDPSSAVQTLRNVQDANADAALAAMVKRWPYTRALYPILKRMLAREPSGRPSDIAEIIPPLRQIQVSLSRLVDLQSWVEEILTDLGRPVKGRRSATGINIPVAPGAASDQAQDAGAPSPAPTRMELEEIVEEKTPVARLKRLPGQPPIREERAGVPDPEDNSMTRVSLDEPPLEGDAGPTRVDPGGLLESMEGETRPGGPVAGFGDPVSTVTDRLTPTPMSAPERSMDPTSALPFSAGALNEGALSGINLSAEAEGGENSEGGPPPPSDPGRTGTSREGEPLAASSGHTPPQPDGGAFLDKTPAWLDQGATPEMVDLAQSQSAPPSNTATPARSPSGNTRRLLFVAAGGALFAVALILLASRFLPSHRASLDGPRPITIDSVPGGAEVVFEDKDIPPGRTPLTRRIEMDGDCVPVEVRRDGYQTVKTCLKPGKDGFVEPIELQPAARAVGIYFYYPLDLEGISISVDGWDVDLRQRVPRRNNQGAVRTYVSRDRHRVKVRTTSCGEVEGEFDLRHNKFYRFIKLVRERGNPCQIAFAQEDEQ